MNIIRNITSNRYSVLLSKMEIFFKKNNHYKMGGEQCPAVTLTTICDIFCQFPAFCV